VHADGERQVVRRELEQRLPSNVNFMKEDVGQKGGQPERLAIGDEVNLVAAASERDSELCGDGARAAVGGIAGDSDFQVSSFHHRSTAAAQSGASGLTRVILAASS